MVKCLKTTALVLIISLLTLFVADSILIMMGVFPPIRLLGDPLVGFRDPVGTGTSQTYQSVHWRYVSSDSGLLVANERGFRSSRSIHNIKEAPAQFRICALGDSHTDLPYNQKYTHPFVLGRILNDSLSKTVDVVNAGRGRYSPLQSYLFYTHFVKDIRPEVLILNLYTGNDFFDMLRVDDRPYYEPDQIAGYAIHPPEWFKHTDPSSIDSWWNKSRVVYVGESMLNAVKILPVLKRVQYLAAMSSEFGGNNAALFSYIWDLSGADEHRLVYPPAYAAQILNQHLFFRWFPGAAGESLHRMAFLLRIMRKDNPKVTLVLSPIPSAVLSNSLNSDRVFREKLAELEINYEMLLKEESSLYDSVLAIGVREGWVVIDNRKILHESASVSNLFLPEDLHLSPAGSEILGIHEAQSLILRVREQGLFVKEDTLPVTIR